MDLELDYYDYNVVNAGAAPGSYLGMDPAFLVWIPPLDPGETDILRAIEEDHHYEEIPDRRSDLGSRPRLDTEGAALTPAEYKLIRETKVDTHCAPSGDGSVSSCQNEIAPRRIDPGESRLHDEIITEYRARLNEGNLPIHRILEESCIRVSAESLARHVHDQVDARVDVIPNRLTNEGDKKSETRFAPKANRNRLSNEQERAKATGTINPKDSPARGMKQSDVKREKQFCDDGDRAMTPVNPRSRFSDDLEISRVQAGLGIRGRISEVIVENKAYDENELSRISPTDLNKRRNNSSDVSNVSKYRKDNTLKRKDSGDLDRDYCESYDRKDLRENFVMPMASTPNAQRRGYRNDVAELNAVTEVKIGSAVNIPLREFPASKLMESPARVHCRPKDNRKETILQKEIQSPDYGVEADMKDDPKGFYDLIGEGEDGIKFADDDDDYIDNKVIA